MACVFIEAPLFRGFNDWPAAFGKPSLRFDFGALFWTLFWASKKVSNRSPLRDTLDVIIS